MADFHLEMLNTEYIRVSGDKSLKKSIEKKCIWDLPQKSHLVFKTFN